MWFPKKLQEKSNASIKKHKGTKFLEGEKGETSSIYIMTPEEPTSSKGK